MRFYDAAFFCDKGALPDCQVKKLNVNNTREVFTFAICANDAAKYNASVTWFIETHEALLELKTKITDAFNEYERSQHDGVKHS